MSQSRRRAFRLVLVLAAVVAGIAVAAVARDSIRSYTQARKAVAMIQAVGGSIGFRMTNFGSPTWVYFEIMGRPASTVTDRELMAIADLLHDVESLGLENTGVSTAAIAYFLTRHPTVTRLALHGTDVDHSVVPFLERLPNLEVLDVGRTRIGDESAAALARLPKLRTLVVCGSELSAVGLELIREEAPVIHLVTHSRRCVFGDPLAPAPRPDDEGP